MKSYNIVIGTGETPDSCKESVRVSKDCFNKLAGMKGHIWIHLHGEWWTIVSPEDLRKILINISMNKKRPVVTVSL